MLAYVYDDDLRAQLNARRTNYWDAYIADILDMLGLRPATLSLRDLEQGAALERVGALVVGQQSGEALSPAARDSVRRWVRAGGTLIGFAVEGLDDVFGIDTMGPAVELDGGYTPRARILQGADDWAINGYFNFRSHRLTREIHHLLFLEQMLPVVSDISMVRLNGATELAVLHDTTGKVLCLPAIAWHEYGRGHAGYFAFDVAKTIWLLHQGRPAPDHPEESKYPRAHDMSILGRNSRLVPYADEMAFLLQNMIAVKPHPFIYQIPPKDGRAADALLYYGGDEYRGPTKISLRAAEFMHERGLPYQTNIESDNHPMTAEEHRRLGELGTEVSAYYHLYPDDGYTMTEEHYRFQSDRFFERFGYRPVVTVNHCLRWKGWTGPAKWMLAAGGRADNGFSGKVTPNDSHFRNSAGYCFGFGTTYPFYFRDDWRGGNARIDFMEQPIICYELGHRGSTSVNRDPETRAFEEVHFIVGMAIRYHFVMNMFYHPAYLVDYPACRDAIDEILRYIEYRKATVVHMNNRMVAEWWDARNASTVKALGTSEDGGRYRCRCEYDGGMVVKVPVPDGREATLSGDGAATAPRLADEFDHRWLYVVVPQGEHTFEVSFKEAANDSDRERACRPRA